MTISAKSSTRDGRSCSAFTICHTSVGGVSNELRMAKALNPLRDLPASDVEDLACVQRAQSGSREALEEVIARHQGWIYNIVLRMLYYPQDAEDATQEILIKLITRLSTFEGRSSFRTWLYEPVGFGHRLHVRSMTSRSSTLPRDKFISAT